jgi:hypothetical protein
MNKKLSNQEVFDRVWDHFITKKNPQSIDNPEDHSCLYRGPNGKKCAAGILIPDEKYSPELEDASACPDILIDFKESFGGKVFLNWEKASKDPSDLYICRVAIILKDIVENVQFVREMQLLHDSIYADSDSLFTQEFRHSMINFAERHNLTIPENSIILPPANCEQENLNDDISVIGPKKVED